jgi:hypothetical protein
VQKGRSVTATALLLAITDAGWDLKRDAIRIDRHRALGCCLSMIFSENRCALFRIML